LFSLNQPNAESALKKGAFCFIMNLQILNKELNIMQLTDILTAISTVGFPIVCCLLLGWYVKTQSESNQKQLDEIRKDHKEEVSKMVEALNNNTLVLRQILDKLGE
jgi:hypothetical protein